MNRNNLFSLFKRFALAAASVGALSTAHAQEQAQKLPSPEHVQKLLAEGCKLWACTTDAAAVAKMSAAERKLVQEILQKLPAETSVAELEKKLGPMFRGAGTQRPVWLGPDKDKDSQIAVYLKNNKVVLIRWLKLRQWLWERAPSPAN